MAHTPGPWTVETVPTQIGVCHKIGPFPGSCGKPVGYACVYVDGASAYKPRLGKEAELLANAVLMAAAPDLLMALRRIETECVGLGAEQCPPSPHGCPKCEMLFVARAAIANATGE